MSTPQHADAARDRAALARLFEAESTLALATVDAQGAACIAPLYYVAGDALHLYWLSSPASRHSRNLRAGALAEVTVFHATSDWRAICGAQCRGMVAVVRGARRRALLARYAARFGLGPAWAEAIARSSLYEFTPHWIRYLDNRRGFGYKTEIVIGDATGYNQPQ